MRIHHLLNCWEILWRQNTTKAQNTCLSEIIVNKLPDMVKEKIKMLDIQPCDIYYVDQTSIYYSMESSYTLAPKLSCTVSIKGCNSNKQCLVMLGASLRGGRLLPYIVFDGKAEGSIHQELILRKGCPDNVQLVVQESAWLDESIMLDWIEKVWRLFAVTGERIYYLLLDNCPAHCTLM
jgi:DDE superfamily endonuclease